jgi:hypothetical protein
MSDKSFLKHLITENIYLIKEKNVSYTTEVKQEIPTIIEEPKTAIIIDIFPPKKGIVLVNTALNDSEKELLYKIFKAINFTENDIEILVKSNFNVSAENIHPENKLIIAFGLVSFTELYTIKKINNAQFIIADSLGKLEGSAELKKQLWGLLKSFSL